LFVNIVSMDIQNKTKEEIIKELQKLREEYHSLKFLYEEDINKRNQSEEALRQSESKYRLLAENSSDVIWTLDNEYCFTYISPSIYQLRGLTSEEAIRESIQDTMPPQSQEVVYKAIAKGKENEKAKNYVPVKVEIEQYHKDGHLIWVEITIRAMLDDNGKKIGYVGISRDITVSKQAEQALNESLNLFNGLIKKVPIGIYIVCIRADMQMKFEYVSDKWCEIHQIKREDALTDISNVHKMVHKDDIKNFLKLNEEAARDKKNFLWEGRFVIEGAIRWFRIESVPINYEDEDYRWYGVVQDITERKRSELALRQSEQNFRTLANMAKIMISIVSDINREKYLYVNDEWASALEYTKEEAKKLKPIDVLTPESHRQVMEFATKRIQGIDVPSSYEITVVTKSGKLKYLDSSSIIINFDNQKAYLTTSLDITEHKLLLKSLSESESTLRELNAQKDKFFSIIAHDLKSPFNAILGLSELLLEQINANNYIGIDNYAKIIGQSSQRAYDLLINLLEWSRAQSGRWEFTPENFDMGALIKENIRLLESNAEQKAITINEDLASKITAFADKQMISTILRNLISNAIKFTQKGGEIKIFAEYRENEILITVMDNGIGIESGRMENLFRIDKSNSTPGTSNEQGTGLGLILSKEFVEKHGGKIWAESKQGKGTVFYFTLPNEVN